MAFLYHQFLWHPFAQQEFIFSLKKLTERALFNMTQKAAPWALCVHVPDLDSSAALVHPQTAMHSLMEAAAGNCTSPHHKNHPGMAHGRLQRAQGADLALKLTVVQW